MKTNKRNLLYPYVVKGDGNGMKKIISALLMISILLILAGCDTTVVNENGIERQVFGRLVEIERYRPTNTSWQYLTYDKDTKVMYIIAVGTYASGISPYYVLNEKGEPVVGIYNK